LATAWDVHPGTMLPSANFSFKYAETRAPIPEKKKMKRMKKILSVMVMKISRCTIPKMAACVRLPHLNPI